MAATAPVLTWHRRAADGVAGYADWLRMVHMPEGVRLIERVEAGRLFELDGQRPVMTDPLAFPLFSTYEFADDPELIFERARSVERQGGRAVRSTVGRSSRSPWVRATDPRRAVTGSS